MNDKFIDDLLDQPIPAADSNAKKIAINSALSEFSQGLEESSRPISEQSTTRSGQKPSLWSRFMSFLNNPYAGRAFATVAVAFVAVSITFLIPDTNRNSPQTTQSEPSVINENGDIDSSITPSPSNSNIGDHRKMRENLAMQENNPTDTAQSQTPQEPRLVKQSESERQGLEQRLEKRDAKLRVEAEKRARSRVKEKRALEKKHAEANNRVQVEAEQQAATTIKADTQPGVNKNNQAADVNLTLQELAMHTESMSATPASAAKPVAPPMQTELVSGIKPELADGFIEADKRPDINEEYPEHQENSIKLTREAPVSTFSIDVDTASYSLVRNQLLNGYLPNPQAVRAEEMINYFSYNYALPKTKQQPFKPSVTVFDSPWHANRKLVHIGIRGYEISKAKAPDSNLVFLLDVSGSMSSANKLPLVKQSVNLLLDTLKPNDTVSIVVYAGAAGMVLKPTKVKNKHAIVRALKNLNAGGSTAGGEGIELAYQLAEQNYDKNAVNRIILATDGDFNVGLQSNQVLKTLVERKRDSGIFLSVLGFGRNNYQDDMMQVLAQNGNGVATYIDSLSEAKKVLVDQATSTLFTIAKDVKIQLEFNPDTVSEYRLIGYETRHLKREDFNNDKVDAGDIGAGHTVTAIYEITPVGSNGSVDALRYAKQQDEGAPSNKASEYGFLKIRYKLPDGQKSKLLTQPITAKSSRASKDVLFSTAVASFAQRLKGGKYIGDMSFADIAKLAQQNKGEDPYGYRSEFIQLVKMANIAKP